MSCVGGFDLVGQTEREKEGVGITCIASQTTAVNGDITDSDVAVGAGGPAVVAKVVVRYVVGVPS